ncbi:MAG TPA: hypothetical protein VIC87_11220 [Vicinamibacteria bacterium]|jgi:hypothetical protein
MLMKIAAITAAVPTALVAGVASLGVLVVDVREGGPNGHHFVIPVPLAVAQTALAFVPSEKTRVSMDREALKHLPVAREVLEALAEGPDGEIVRVEEEDQLVVVEKRGRSLHVKVREHGSDVEVNVPLAVALAAMPDASGQVRTGELATSLWSARFTDLVEVHEGDDHVKVSVW